MGTDLEMPSGEYHKICLGKSGHGSYGDGINLNSVDNLEPHEGIEFESKEEAFAFYQEYARSVGFTTIIKASRRSRMTGKFIDAKFVCSRYGSRKEACLEEVGDTTSNIERLNIPQKRKRGRINRSWSKTDCKACLHVKRRQDGRWVIRTLIKEHNHEIFPGQIHRTEGHAVSELGNGSRGRLKKKSISVSRESGGHKKLEKRKGAIGKEISRRHQLALEDGDAERLLIFVTHMQDENPFFFYAVDLNEEQTLRSILWVDAKGRMDYASFSDVVSVDTTYIENEYKLPLVPFIGVNHHGQFLLLGCGLLADETKSAYVWLMQAWLKAMGGCPPRVILTSQDNMLKEAVSEVFPSSRHCFYLWHILGQMSDKLGHVTRQQENFMAEINECIYGSCTNEELEKRWWKMVDRFSLRDNAWLQSLYEDREYWVPVYMKDVFLAGMCTSHRSGCVNSLVDKYVQRKTTLKVFLDQYKTFIQERYEEEAKADMETLHKQPGLKSPSPFGKQMAALYTHAIFKKFQVEVLGGVACHPKQEAIDGSKKTFRVQDFEQNRHFVVELNDESSEVSCSCRLFEFNGFLCRHVMIVLQMSGLLSIPSQYILKRWTKDTKSREVLRARMDIVPSRIQRYKDLCLSAFKLSNEASLSEESYDVVLNALDETLRKCENMNSSIQNVADSVSRDPSRCEEVMQCNNTLETNKNGIMTSCRQVHPQLEVLSIGMHEGWKTPEQRNSRGSILDDYFGSQELSQGMGRINTITSNRDGYYMSQHNLQSLAQLNSLVSVRDAHYMTQQRIHETGHSSFRPQAMSTCFDIHEGLQDMGQPSIGHPQPHSTAPRHEQSNRHLSQGAQSSQ